MAIRSLRTASAARLRFARHVSHGSCGQVQNDTGLRASGNVSRILCRDYLVRRTCRRTDRRQGSCHTQPHTPRHVGRPSQPCDAPSRANRLCSMRSSRHRPTLLRRLPTRQHSHRTSPPFVWEQDAWPLRRDIPAEAAPAMPAQERREPGSRSPPARTRPTLTCEAWRNFHKTSADSRCPTDREPQGSRDSITPKRVRCLYAPREPSPPRPPNHPLAIPPRRLARTRPRPARPVRSCGGAVARGRVRAKRADVRARHSLDW